VRWPICTARWPCVGSACVDIRPSPKTDVLVIVNIGVMCTVQPSSLEKCTILWSWNLCLPRILLHYYYYYFYYCCYWWADGQDLSLASRHRRTDTTVIRVNGRLDSWRRPNNKLLNYRTFYVEWIFAVFHPRLSVSSTNLLARPTSITSNSFWQVFSGSLPCTWNSLPAHKCCIDKVSFFKCQLKSRLFHSALAL